VEREETSMSVDSAFERAQAIITSVGDRIDAIRSEEDAKVQIITRIVTEVLEWSHEDISSETHHDNGFSDYLITDGEHKAFVIEAKRIGEISIGTASKFKGTYKVNGPVLKPAAVGIAQAASYCHPEGIPLAVLTDGIRWIIFLPWVAQASYKDKQAIVFPSLEAILAEFAMFYELLSKPERKKSTFRVIFDQINENRLVVDRPLVAPIAASENSIVQKSALAFDLEKVFSRFFAGLTGDDDPDMIIDCFVETKESRVADFSLERITKNVLGNISPHDSDVGAGLSAIVKGAVAGEPGQTVFIVGPSGAGKSTFLDRFFKRTLSSEIRERCVLIYVNVLDASGSEASALSWMTERSIAAIEEQLFPEGYPEWGHLQALYHLEYLKRSKGIDALLYSRDKEAFKEKFAEYVEGQVQNDREGYLRRLLADVVRNRKRLPVFVVDNTDEFDLEFKSSTFQYFQALRRGVEHCLLLFPATDRSAWTFSKTEIFNIYSSRSFFLPTPSPREVFRKRVDYLKQKISVTKGDQKIREYLAGRGIRIQIKELDAFAQAVENVFVEQDYPSRVVGELSNYNMRKALGLSKRVITSSVLKIEDIIRSYITGTMVAPTAARFMNALMKGDYEFYKHGDEALLFPLYQVDGNIRQSPLTNLRTLTLLNGLHTAATEDADRYITVSSLKAYFDVMSISEVALQRSLEGLLLSGLVEPYDLSKKNYSEDQRIAISESGVIHLSFASYNPVYFEQMALTTRIPDSEVSSAIRGAYAAKKTLDARLEDIRGLFCKYLIEEDARYCLVPETSEYRAQRDVTLDLAARWGGANDDARGPRGGPERVAEAVRGVVERFDQPRGFGFVDIPTLRESAFLHVSILERDGIEEVNEGDEIVCDVTRGDKGFVVSNVREIAKTDRPVVVGQVVKIFDDRGYGFVYVPETGVDAFFHFHLLSQGQKDDLYEGQELFVEVTTDRQGKSQVRRVLSQPVTEIPRSEALTSR
jgi:cold shock CspA family protein/KaiC/GvpD/RAD55 family RecA-like ATPase